jgi:hypothetical protein
MRSSEAELAGFAPIGAGEGGFEFDGFDIDISFFETDAERVSAQGDGEKIFLDVTDVRAGFEESLTNGVRRHRPLANNDMRGLADEFDREFLSGAERFRDH